MTSPLFDFEDDEPEWGLGTYPPAIVQESDMTRLIRIAESRKAAQKLWDAVQKELVRRD